MGGGMQTNQPLPRPGSIVKPGLRRQNEEHEGAHVSIGDLAAPAAGGSVCLLCRRGEPPGPHAALAGFRPGDAPPIQMRAGTIIDYRPRLHEFPVRWRSEITAGEPPHHFVDEQRQGPYKLWVHEHRFRTWDQGTQVVDDVRYAVPGGWLVDRLFVRRDVERLFQFRRQKLQELFPTQNLAS